MLERDDERERIASSLLAPQEHRRRGARLHCRDGGVRRIEFPLLDRTEPDPARFHSSISSRIAAIPAAAHASSSRPPGAPETPIAPRSVPPASIIRPPPTAATPG